jgi:hypothetical protein
MAKSTPRRPVVSTTRVRTTVYLSPIANQRLGLAAVAETKTQSDVVELLINRHLSGYVLSIRGERLVHSTGSANPEVEVNLSEPSAA